MSAAWIHRAAWLPFLGLLWLAGVPLRRDFAAEVLTIFLLAASACLLLRTSRAWRAASVLHDTGWPSLRTLAWLTPASIAAQVVLGAAYRHNLAGVMAHVVWAFAATILALMTATFVLTNPEAQALTRRVATGLAVLAGVQLMLGVGAYVARIASTAGAAGMPWLASAHAAAGGLVLALTSALGLLLRHARPRMEGRAA